MDQVVDTVPRGMVALGVHHIRHWTDKTFSFRCERPASFRFRSGEFVMIGLMVEGKPLVGPIRSVRPHGTRRSNSTRSRSPTVRSPRGSSTSARATRSSCGRSLSGTLVHDALVPGKRLFLFSTGTGIAPFASVIRDPETYEKFDQVVLTHTCREVAELAYGHDLIERIRTHEFLPEIVGDKLTHIATTTREESPAMGRMTDWIRDGRLAEAAGGGSIRRPTG
jgi:ferredoxin/flavodoxin---NADP+ reductase